MRRGFALPGLLLLLGTVAAPARAAPEARRPNVVLILLDDVGFAHLGAFGSPIATPNIDALAAGGLRYRNFHTTALCSPTRAALLTGRNHHSVNNGVVEELATPRAGYNGDIPKSAATVAEVLREAGYDTAALGKWHNTPTDEVAPWGPFDRWPTSLGFEYFYGFLGGETDQYSPILWENTRPVEAPKTPGYHLTVDLADHAITWIDQQRQQSPDKPFFLYFATGAGHSPHQVPQKYVDKYKGRFDGGWDAYREQVLARQKQLGVVPADAVLSARPDPIVAWETLTPDEKRLFARFMEVYAGFIDQTDEQIGRVLAELKRQGLDKDTIVILASDNGASGEGGLVGAANEYRSYNGQPESLAYNLSMIDKLGGPETSEHYPAGWALAGNTPFRYWKQIVHEGGVHDPFIVSWPGHIRDGGAIRGQWTHVVDVMPTILDVTGVAMPSTANGTAQMPLEGQSFAASLTDAATPTAQRAQYFEMLGNRGIYQNGWKAVTFHGNWPWTGTFYNSRNFDDDVWELFDTTKDFTETNDLATQEPARLKAMKALFLTQAQQHQVLPLTDSSGARALLNATAPTAGKTHFEYPSPVIRIPYTLAPSTRNRSFEIKAEADVPTNGAEGVIVADDGRFGGYTFYVQRGRLHFVYNDYGDTRYRIDGTTDVPSGHVTLGFKFTKSGDYKGTGELFVNGASVGTGSIGETEPFLFSATETFDVGSDTGTSPSEDYETPYPFTGTLGKVTVDLGPPSLPNLGNASGDPNHLDSSLSEREVLWD